MAYSVLAHEATIDIAWDSAIRPLLVDRFPETSAAGLDRARSFAYGGSVIQDLGYYPFGNRFFSNLLHYARSGDFVEALVADAGDSDELAFALGALAHYINDSIGHPAAVNRSIPIMFPKLARKFGETVTYEQAPKKHLIVEFSFDVAHTARTAYPVSAYRHLIGFRVALSLLERAFRETYALNLPELFGDPDGAVSTYRYAVSQLVPALTAAAWRDKHKLIERRLPEDSRETFVLVYPPADYERDFGRDYRKPARFARFVAFLYRSVPKIGPLRPLAFKVPTLEADKLFTQSVLDADASFFQAVSDVRDRCLRLPNSNLDSGQPTERGTYRLADDTYDELLHRLSAHDFAGLTPLLRRNIALYYRNMPDSPATRLGRGQRSERVERELVALLRGSEALRMGSIRDDPEGRDTLTSQLIGTATQPGERNAPVVAECASSANVR